MRRNRGFQSLAAGGVIALMLGGVAYSFNGPALSTFVAEPAPVQTTLLSNPVGIDPVQNTEAANAASKFIRGMSERDAQAVWMFASEEDQEAFGTEAEILAAFAETFPVLTEAKHVTLTQNWREGDTPFVAMQVEDSSGQLHRARIGLWLDDAGDWKVVSCDVEPATAQVASR